MISPRPGRLFVISAPSGTGKTTLINRLLKECPELRLSVSWTTRPPRSGERDGVDYHFADAVAFQRAIDAGEFLEWAEVHGHRYGTPRAPLEANRAHGIDTILDIDVQGGVRIRALDPEARLIFLMPPSLEALEERLRRRGSESPAALRRRIETARQEIALKDRYDYVIINDKLDSAFAQLRAAIQK